MVRDTGRMRSVVSEAIVITRMVYDSRTRDYIERQRFPSSGVGDLDRRWWLHACVPGG
jgi:hypothetical protein